MIFKVIAIAFVGLMAVVALRQVKPELAVFAGITAGVIIIFAVASELTEIVSVFKDIGTAGGEESGGSGNLFSAIVKIIGIGYVTEYSAGICDDYGSQSLGKKVQLAGKVSIFGMAVPIILSIIEAVRLLVT